MPAISVIIPTHNPRRAALQRTLAALCSQTLPPREWECLLVDNGSIPAIDAAAFADVAPVGMRVVTEPRLGLTAARCRGIQSALGEIVVFVDDDNELAPNYLEVVAAEFAGNSTLGATGGRTIPEFAVTPEPWVSEFNGLLALRNLGEAPLFANWARANRDYPACAPIGAGMALRRIAGEKYVAALERDPVRQALDRTGKALLSGGDNDLVMTILEQGFEVGYCPSLRLTHLIPGVRCTREYLGRLNRAIARSWLRVLALHGIRTWPAAPKASVPVRKMRAWFRRRAWAGPAEWVRWQGDCGHFEGRADLHATPTP